MNETVMTKKQLPKVFGATEEPYHGMPLPDGDAPVPDTGNIPASTAAAAVIVSIAGIYVFCKKRK